ncbi:MAG: hypothetical protein MUE81_06065 [Thermoflexibacter sp.]|jgi:hypothetical protein|nr:hypothetical protein [Thermoflexibacter sp.]
MGKYKKGVCEKCGFEGYVNDHHVIPRKVKKDDNKTTIRLCLNCHQHIHELLPDEKKEEAFYVDFTQKWLLGLLAILLLFCFFINLF